MTSLSEILQVAPEKRCYMLRDSDASGDDGLLGSVSVSGQGGKCDAYNAVHFFKLGNDVGEQRRSPEIENRGPAVRAVLELNLSDCERHVISRSVDERHQRDVSDERERRSRQ